VRKVEVRGEPALLAARAYPAALSELLAASDARRYLQAVNAIERRLRGLVSSYLDGQVSERELKEEFVRLAEEREEALLNALAALDVMFVVKEAEEELKIVEKVLAGIGGLGSPDAFTRQLLRGVVRRSLERARSSRKVLKALSYMIEEKINEINFNMEYLKKAVSARLLPREEAAGRLAALAREYAKFARAYRELKALSLSLNLGLTGASSILFRLEEKADELKVLQARLAVGEISSDEYMEAMNNLEATLEGLRSGLKDELKNFELLQEAFEKNSARVAEILGGDVSRRISKMLKASRRCAERIASVYMDQGSGA
jgi:hypothetical protein